MDLAKDMGIGLDARFVDLWMNGKYLGVYLMTPKNDYNSPKNGYILENDNYLEDEDQFVIPGMFEIGKITNDRGYYNRISVKDIGDKAKEYGIDNAAIEAYFDDAWAAVEDYDSEDYQNYFDMDSWAKMFLMYEVSKTYDCFSGSLLMHRDGLSSEDKLIAGPAWDYDVSFGRTLHKFFVGISEPVQLNAEGWYNDSIGLMGVDEPISMFQELGKHASFMRHVSKIYNEYKDTFEGVAANVDRQREILRASALMDFDKTGLLNLAAEYVVAPNTMKALGTGEYALNYEITLNWENYVNNLKEWCTKRVMWLSDHLKPGMDIVTFHGGTVKTSEMTLNDNATADEVHVVNGLTDTPDTAWFADAVRYVSDQKIMTGTTETTFEPQTKVTRAMVVQILYALEGKPEGAADAGMTDVGEGTWYADAVNWAKANNVVGGYPDNTFRPNEDISREQLAVILKAYAGDQKINGADLQGFNDSDDVSEWAADAVAWAVGAGLIAGRDNGMLAPGSGATRAEVAQIMKNFCEKFGK